MDERTCRWVRPTYWGGIGCSCDDGHCCRTCRRGDPNSPNKCAICGNDDICKANLCNHPCCAQASPERVAERVKFIVPTLHRKLTVALGNEVLNLSAGWIVEEPFAYGRTG